MPADSAAGLRSPGTASPSPERAREEWHSGIVADLRIGEDGVGEPQREPGSASPFAAASGQQPLEETVIVTPSRIYHGLTRPGLNRCLFLFAGGEYTHWSILRKDASGSVLWLI